MASINFKGKNIIWNHHLSVPYHTLEEDKTLSYKAEKADGNLLIEGDNLLALKSLLPKYMDKVGFIYIDPPYNTGDEKWIYNDNANSPLIKSWLKKEVAKDDLTRHDKWLCMMTPRLKLLRDLLKKEGVIFVSIGEDEVGNLKLLMEEIFGQDNFISIISRVAKTASNKGNFFAPSMDYIVCFAKDITNITTFKDEVDITLYKKIETDGPRKGEKYRDDVAFYQSSLDIRPNQRYFVECPDGSFVIPPGTTMPTEIADSSKTAPAPDDGVWRWSVNTYLENKHLLVFKNTRRSPLLDETGAQAKWNIYTKSYLTDREKEGTKPRNFFDEFINRKGADYLKTVDIDFDYAKPVDLIKYLIKISNSKDEIILDSFAGSGTTAQAVMDLNKSVTSNGRYILVQMTESTDDEPRKNVCESITRKRIVNVIKKEDYNSGFVYQKVSTPIDAESMLSGNLPTFKELAKYVYYLASGKSLEKEKEIDESTYHVGIYPEGAVYLIYHKSMDKLTKLH